MTMADDTYRERKQKLYESIDEELEERLKVKETEDKGTFKSRLDQFGEEIRETAGEGASAGVYIGTGAAGGWVIEKFVPLRSIPILGKYAPYVCTVLGGAYGLRTWFATRKKRKLQRDLEKEVREEEG